MTKSTSTLSHTPQDRLTRICDDMIATFNQNGEKREDDRAIVFLVDDAKGGIGIAGYEDDKDALVDLIVHLRAIFRARSRSPLRARRHHAAEGPRVKQVGHTRKRQLDRILTGTTSIEDLADTMIEQGTQP